MVENWDVFINELYELLEKYGYEVMAWSTCEHDPGQLKSEFDLSIFCDKIGVK